MFSTCSLKSSAGVIACRWTSTSSTWNVRSAIASPSGRSARLTEFREEPVDPLPGLLAAGYALPRGADEPDERVAAIDRRPVILARSLDAVDEQRFDIRLELSQDRVAGDE